MAISVQEVTSREEWEEFIGLHTEANFLQSFDYGEVQKRLGRKVFRMGFYGEGGKLVGVMLAVLEDAKRGKYLAVAGGPILDFENKELVQVWRDTLRELGASEGCAFVRVRPQLRSDEISASLFESLGFKGAKMHLEAELTSQLDLTLGLENIRSNFRKNTRREIKNAKKSGIVIRESQNPEDINEFYELQLNTAKRHGFVPFSEDRLMAEFEVFAKTDNVVLYSAYTNDDKLIAQAFVVFYGAEASYHYGASSELGREEPGAYLIQWKAINDAVRRGCMRYNFWGVVRENETGHRFYGVSVFKRGFRGDDVEYLHAQDLVISNVKYLKNYVIESVRKRLRKV